MPTPQYKGTTRFVKEARMQYERSVLPFLKNSLFRNSLYLMLSTGIMAGLGFLFWLLSARLVSAADIGLATTLLTVMNTISVLGLVGFDTSIIRYLAHAPERNDKINTSMLVVGVATLLLSGGFVLFSPLISPHLAFLALEPLTGIAFVIFAVMSALNLLSGAIFLAYRDTKYTFMSNTALSIIKLVLPFVFLSWGAFGIFASAAVAQSIGFLLCIWALVSRFDYRPRLTFDLEIIRRVRAYSTGNYISDILGFGPLSIVPIMVTNHLGTSQAAYFNIVMLIGGLLFAIPSSVTRMFFAEGSFDTTSIQASLRRTVYAIGLFLIPAILMLIAGSSLILGLFGTEYIAGATTFLWIIALSGIPVAASSIYSSLFRISHNVHALIWRNAFYAVSLVTLTYLSLPWGLIGVGMAWISASLVQLTISHLLYKMEVRRA